MNVAFLPVYANPYQRLLAGGLARAGVAVTLLPGLPSAAWLRANRATTDVLHFHWLYGLYMAQWRTPWQAAAFLRRFKLARDLGYRVVWTAHNVMPHRAAGLGALHRHVRRLMMAEADAVIVHCEAGRRELLARFPRRGATVVIPIGSYANLYPGTADRATARARLGLDGAAFVTLTLGNIAAYKGLERFAAQFIGRGRRQIVGRQRARLPAAHRRPVVALDDRPALVPQRPERVHLRQDGVEQRRTAAGATNDQDGRGDHGQNGTTDFADFTDCPRICEICEICG